MINHHISDELLLSYAAGAVSAAEALFVSSHLDLCHHCAKRTSELAVVGGALLEDISVTPVSNDAFAQLMAKIPLKNDEPTKPKAMHVTESEIRIPRPVFKMLPDSYDNLPWRMVAPGVRRYHLPVRSQTNESAYLLKLSPGFVTPEHSHHGNELTMVLKGSFSDDSGRYKFGDVQETDGSVDHQPIADTEEECICLVVTDAPLEFKSILGKILQPIFRM